MARKLDRSLNLGQVLAQPLSNERYAVLINHMAISMFMTLCGAKRFTFQELGWMSSCRQRTIASDHPMVDAEDGLSMKTRGLFCYNKNVDFGEVEVGLQRSEVFWGFTVHYEWVLCTVSFECVIYPDTFSYAPPTAVGLTIRRVELEQIFEHFQPREVWKAFGVLAQDFADRHREAHRVAQSASDEWVAYNRFVDDLWVFEPSQGDSKTNPHTD